MDRNARALRMLVSERDVLLQRARTVMASGSMLCLTAGVAVLVPRKLGLIGNVYATDNYFADGSPIWVGTRGASWLVLSAVLLLVGIAVLAAGIREYRLERQTRDVPAARTVRRASPDDLQSCGTVRARRAYPSALNRTSWCRKMRRIRPARGFRIDG